MRGRYEDRWGLLYEEPCVDVYLEGIGYLAPVLCKKVALHRTGRTKPEVLAEYADASTRWKIWVESHVDRQKELPSRDVRSTFPSLLGAILMEQSLEVAETGRLLILHTPENTHYGGPIEVSMGSRGDQFGECHSVLQIPLPAVMPLLGEEPVN